LNKKKIALITIYISAAIVAAYPLALATQQYAKFNPDSKHLAEIILLALVGGSLFALRHTKRITAETLETIENVELLTLIVIPSVEMSTFLMKTPSNFVWAMLPFMVGTMSWFNLIVARHKISKDPKQEKKFVFFSVYMMFVLVLIALAATWEILALIPYQNHLYFQK
jgi:hypothetical protein